MNNLNNLFTAELIVNDEYKSDAPINIRVQLTNLSDQSVFILKAATPFEGPHSNSFEVHDTLNHRAIPYDGLLVKRGAPTFDSFLFVGPRARVETTVDISSAYAVSAPGRYTVSLRAMVAYSIGSLNGNLLANFHQHQSQLNKQSLSTTPSAFHVLPGQYRRMTNGEKNRNPKAFAARLTPGIPAAAGGFPTPPNIADANPTQEGQIAQAHQNAYGLVVTALQNLGAVGGPATTDPIYNQWFGAYTDSRFNIVTAVYGQVKTNFEGPAITYSAAGPACQPSWFGYTSYGSTTIYLCAKFWAAPATGTDSQAGTLVHEHTHSDANTLDLEYTQIDCQILASQDPDKAVNNADNYEYYANG